MELSREMINKETKSATEFLEECDILLAECSEILKGLEEDLKNRPPPSEECDWKDIS